MFNNDVTANRSSRMCSAQIQLSAGKTDEMRTDPKHAAKVTKELRMAKKYKVL